MNPLGGPVVVKVGGSLFDLPDLGHRLCTWLDTQKDEAILLVPGGGGMADVVRRLDQVHRLGDESAHWLALRALALNAHFLQKLLPSAEVVGDSAEEVRPARWAILDAHVFARADESRDGRLPHSWQATSDAVAARAAVVLRASRLVLLKSATLPEDVDWFAAARMGYVDPMFPEIVRQADGLLNVQVVNLREWH